MSISTALRRLNDSPHDFQALCDYVYHEAVYGDRPAAIRRGLQYLDAMPRSVEMRARTLALLLPHLEAEARTAAGLSYYSTDDLDELPFIHSRAKAAQMHANILEWFERDKSSDAVLNLAASYFAQHDYVLTDQFLDHVRGKLEHRAAAAHFTGDWFNGLEAGLAPFVGDLPPVFPVVTDASVDRRVFVGCDAGYFAKYGVTMAKSLGKTNAVVHFHIFDSDGTVEAKALDGICQYTMTSEWVRIGAADKAKFYYAPIRLVRMAALCQDGIPTIMLDADTMCTGSLDGMFERLENHDAVLCRMPGRMHFHTQMNASVVGIAPVGLGYLNRVAAYIAKCFRQGMSPWCLDQIALNCTLRNMQMNGPVNAVACGPGVYDGTFDCVVNPQKVDEHNPLWPSYQAALKELA